MSLEVHIQALTAAVVALTQQLQTQTAVVPQAQPQQPPQNFAPQQQAAPQFQPQAAPQQQQMPATPNFAPQQQAAPQFQPQAAPQQQQMPATPNFAPQQQAQPNFAPQPVQAPFADPKGLVDYATAAYGQLGATKGAGIQNVITSLGHQNISDVRPDQYGAFYAGVESLKTQP